MLSVLFHIQALKWTLPTAVMIASAPATVALWSAIRVVTFLLPGRMYIAADDKLYSLYIRLLLFFFHNYTGTEVHLYGNTGALTDKKKNVIFICNHQCTVDWVITNMLASSQGCIGRVRYILKDGLRFLPLAGFYLKQRSCVFVKKTGKFDEHRAAKQIAQYQRNDVPVWLVIFAEGTRINPEVPECIEKSKELAIEQGVEPFEHVLTPKARGLQLAIENIREHIDDVYDVTIGYSDSINPKTGDRVTAPGMLEYLSINSPQIHVHIDQVPIKDVPKDYTEIKQWLLSRFRSKDKLMSYFYSKHHDEPERGRFPGPSEVMKLPVSSTLPSFLFYSAFLAVLFGTQTGRTIYWKTVTYGTVLGIIWTTVKS